MHTTLFAKVIRRNSRSMNWWSSNTSGATYLETLELLEATRTNTAHLQGAQQDGTHQWYPQASLQFEGENLGAPKPGCEPMVGHSGLFGASLNLDQVASQNIDHGPQVLSRSTGLNEDRWRAWAMPAENKPVFSQTDLLVQGPRPRSKGSD
eukprot:219772-Pyramimonas_sp.AAC.1